MTKSTSSAHVECGGELVPGVAPAAMQAGCQTAENVVRSLRGLARQPFRYRDKGMLATIGRGAAVAKIGPIKASGFFAWLLWLFVHIFFLIGFRNRLIVMIHWAWSYVTFDRGARLITEPLKEPLLELNKCPDLVVNRGHYFGTSAFAEEPPLSDDDKRALIEFLKTF